jgi:hypothetical protein
MRELSKGNLVGTPASAAVFGNLSPQLASIGPDMVILSTQMP